ncbi:HlyD family efflux transporter periplasmic adaptor subunit [Pseudomonas sp. ABC1]|uniref:efflux RND transporter periplasmic adaptor subunit n=1 Tax=Pseudomonas sp. ABC1 TaxID=2748080 RepID=UPI0015C36306|nr:HlyD family efflux transporter periplasmic adaptor subunit [Pseudomonas sp. ABC1]QLF92417.1 HlyD family efflux transporter periplasmic adaptor subunit [Pseudomonas sp. ABC1]
MKSNFLIGLTCLALSIPALAHEGHDDEAPAPVSADSPRRQPDGSVFLPKPTQRQLGVRTQILQAGEWPRTQTLSATVVPDPNASGWVQPLLAGRLEAGPNGLPRLGQRVSKGDILGYVVATGDTLERAGQAAQLAEWRSARSLLLQRQARLKELSDSIPRRELEALDAELSSLQARIGALNAGLNAREPLKAPVSGIISTSSAVIGQIVDARELLFEVSDPTHIQVEALAYDPALADDIAGASLSIAGRSVELSFIGAANSLRAQALPLRFQASGSDLPRLPTGQNLNLTVRSASTLHGMPAPISALAKNASNQDIVWVKSDAERYAPRTVTFTPLDGSRVVLTSGVKADERVVTEATALINQIR